MLIMSTTINFIYSGCSGCKKKNKNNGNVSNGGHKSKPGDGKPSDKGDKGDKGKGMKTDKGDKGKGMKTDKGDKGKGMKTDKGDKEVKPEVKPEVKIEPPKGPTSQEIKLALLQYINNREGNRDGLEVGWMVDNGENDSFIIKFGLFKVTIAKDEINKIKNLDKNQIEKIVGTMEMTRNDTTKFKFSGDSKCTLGNLVKSLNKLEKAFRVNKTEHLYVKLTVGNKNLYNYINLSDGLIYGINGSTYIGRSSKGSGDYDKIKTPLWSKIGKWFDVENNTIVESTAKVDDDLTSFNTPLYTKEDIDKFILTVQS